MDEHKESKIPTITSLGNEQIKNTENIKQQYYQKYLDGSIALKAIPPELLSTQILNIAIEREPQEFIDIMFMYVKAKIINTNVAYYVNLLPDTFKTQELYNRLFEIKPSQYYKFIPLKFRTQKMAEELIEINPNNIKIILAEHRTEKMFNEVFEHIDKLWLIKHMPLYFKTPEVCEQAFSENKECFGYIKDEFKTRKMCEEAVHYNSEMFKLVPDELKTQKMCEKAIDDGKNINTHLFYLVPNKYKTSEMCQKVFQKDKQQFVNIPDEFKTIEMCEKAVQYNFKMFKLVPKNLITQEMCKVAFNRENIKQEEMFELIPDEFKTTEMCITMLKINVSKYAKKIPKSQYNNEVLSTIIIELKKLIETKNTIKLDSDIYMLIIRMYPHLLKAFNREKIEEIIIQELYNVINGNITLEDLSKKYDININTIKKIIEKAKNTNIEIHNKMQEIFNNQELLNQKIMIEDIINLSNIIESLGNIEKNSLTLEQKIKFSYLYKKYIRNRLEDIYKFDYQSYLGENARKTRNFFDNVLRYKVIYKGNIYFDSDNSPKLQTSIFNNSWLEEYSKDKFFGIKDGIPTIENRYGKNAELLTQNHERVIVEMLKVEGIPLTDVIVKTAFKEYFKDNLFEYIYELKNYDTEFLEVKQRIKK